MKETPERIAFGRKGVASIRGADGGIDRDDEHVQPGSEDVGELSFHVGAPYRKRDARRLG